MKIVESSYLAAATSLIWIALYYLPIGGAFFRLALPLPLALLQIRRGFKTRCRLPIRPLGRHSGTQDKAKEILSNGHRRGHHWAHQ